MIKVGILCEYNPFHNGHKRQVEAIRARFSEEVLVVALMSGNFVQRGEGAILPKGYRAQSALYGGADLVLEFPYPWSGACAEIFAGAGVSILTDLGVEYLAFGSETGDLTYLQHTADKLSDPRMEEALSARLSAAEASRSYASVREEVYRELFDAELPQKPNDILGVAYLLAIREKKSSLVPLVIKREGRESATASRKAYLARDSAEISSLVPQSSLEQMAALTPLSSSAFEKVILSFWRLADPEALRKIADLPYDLAARLSETAKKSRILRDFWEKAATKKYTNARIRRATLSAILGVTDARVKEKPLFTRLLGTNEKGRAFLAAASFPILCRAGQYREYEESLQEQVLFADRADSFYALFDENPPLHKPFIL